jgi:hypothetical protein
MIYRVRLSCARTEVQPASGISDSTKEIAKPQMLLQIRGFQADLVDLRAAARGHLAARDAPIFRRTFFRRSPGNLGYLGIQPFTG